MMQEQTNQGQPVRLHVVCVQSSVCLHDAGEVLLGNPPIYKGWLLGLSPCLAACFALLQAVKVAAPPGGASQITFG
jgi:hypothetical protein